MHAVHNYCPVRGYDCWVQLVCLVLKVQLVSKLLTPFKSDEAFASRVTLPAHYLEGVGCMLRARVKPSDGAETLVVVMGWRERLRVWR